MATAARFINATSPADARKQIQKQSIFGSPHPLPTLTKSTLPNPGIFKLKPNRRESMPNFSTPSFSSSSTIVASSTPISSSSSSSSRPASTALPAHLRRKSSNLP
eukprot:c11076_g1_i1.p2 GENE.c11076_g1_i1~~c11076_g1_i1.p2  ORF type:complete len:105 (-),score=18.29 c11076_g1_i1:15-329(-)